MDAHINGVLEDHEYKQFVGEYFPTKKFVRLKDFWKPDNVDSIYYFAYDANKDALEALDKMLAHRCHKRYTLYMGKKVYEYEVDAMSDHDDLQKTKHIKFNGKFSMGKFSKALREAAAKHVCRYFITDTTGLAMACYHYNKDEIAPEKLFVCVRRNCKIRALKNYKLLTITKKFFIRWNGNEDQLTKLKADLENPQIIRNTKLDLEKFYTESAVDAEMQGRDPAARCKKLDGMLCYEELVQNYENEHRGELAGEVLDANFIANFTE